MKTCRLTAVALIIALLLCLLPCALAEGREGAPAAGYRAIEDYTKVHWFAESEGQRAELNGEPNQEFALAVDAAPGSVWTVNAEFVKVRDGQLQPYGGELDVTQYCAWDTGALALEGNSVALPGAEGAYALTGRFTDGDGNLYTCEITFNVSADNEPVPAPVFQAAATTVEEKVAEIVAECKAQGFTDDYHIALWLHDWLIYHANYDYTYTNYDADGVLLKGTGVCDSYSKAYVLLLNAFDIANQRVLSDEKMNHAWNLVKIDGVWCHVDCTWDDPGNGGDENHAYFGMSDGLIGRDHSWPAGGYPAAASLGNYYPIREGMLCFSTDSELDEIMAAQAGSQVSPITVVYVGEDADQTASAAMQAWVGENYWRYGLVNYRMSGTRYVFTLQTEYSDPWEQPENHLEPPVDAPNFELDSPMGRYLLKNYGDNGLVLVLGSTTCSNTRSLLERLSGQLADLYAGGVDVLVSMENTAVPEDLEGIEADYPGYHYVYDGGLLWTYLRAVGFPTENGVTYPCVFVINREGKITYYSTGYVYNLSQLIGEAYAVATDNPLPEPEKHADISGMLNGTGNVNDITGGESIISAVRAASADRDVVLLLGYGISNLQSQLAYYEERYNIFDKLGVAVVASAYQAIDDDVKASYGHCAFVDYSDKDFWLLQYATGYEGGASVSYQLNLFILKGGEIAAYTKGSPLSLKSCELHAARRLSYDAVVPEALAEIDAEAFRGDAFKRVDLNNGVLKSIRAGAFASCGELEFIRIPESVTIIEDGALSGAGNAVVVCTIGSAGEKYARANGFDYICE